VIAGECGSDVRFHLAGLPTAGIVSTVLRVQRPDLSVVEWDHTRDDRWLTHTLEVGDIEVPGAYRFQLVVGYAAGPTPRRTRIRTVTVDEVL
jgi:hypothetical protein